MRYNQNWDDLGRTIQDAVDWAVGSRNYHHLNQTIRQVIETAVDVGGEAVRRAAQNVQSQPEQPSSVRTLYGSTGGKFVWAVVKGFFGCCFGGLGALALLGFLTMGFPFDMFPALVAAVLMAGGGGWLVYSGLNTLGMVKRFKTYRRLLGSKTQYALDKLARAVGKDLNFVRKDVRRMIGKGYFLEGHLDHEQKNLITSDATFEQFENARLQLEQSRKQQEAARARAEASRPDARVREVLEKGDAFVAQIRKCNDDIPGVEISAKISRMELIVERIFDRAEEHPEIVPDLKRMMDYYLPMTIKLLNAYAEMDAQPIQGENIENSKREIEATLDTLNLAFEKLLDQVFQDTALDVSSDITVLNTMLAQEGLTEDDLTKLKKENKHG